MIDNKDDQVRQDQCLLKVLAAALPANFGAWQPSPDHNPASQEMLDRVKVLGRLQGHGSSGDNRSEPGAPKAFNVGSVLRCARQPGLAVFAHGRATPADRRRTVKQLARNVQRYVVGIATG
jgi:hypothetical protein